MKIITIDITECLYYLIPIVVVWYISYRFFLKDIGYDVKRYNAGDKQICFIMAFCITAPVCTIYFIVLYMILNSKFIIHL